MHDSRAIIDRKLYVVTLRPLPL